MKTNVLWLKSLVFCSLTSISILGILAAPKLLAQDTNQVVNKIIFLDSIIPANLNVSVESPNEDPNQPFKTEGWAESIEIKRDSLFFNNFYVNGRKALNTRAPIGDFLRSKGIEPKNSSIKGVVLGEIDSNNRYGAIVFESDEKSLFYYIRLNMSTDDFADKTVSASDGSTPFSDKRALLMTLDGAGFTLTPTTLLGLIPVGDKWLKIDVKISEMAGEAVPPLEKPVIDVKKGKLRIRDGTISTGDIYLFNSDKNEISFKKELENQNLRLEFTPEVLEKIMLLKEGEKIELPTVGTGYIIEQKDNKLNMYEKEKLYELLINPYTVQDDPKGSTMLNEIKEPD